MDQEIEFKFEVPPEHLETLRAKHALGAEEVKLQARYFDTADHALADAGLVLRLRKEGGRWVQTAKAAGRGPLERLEHNVDLGVGSEAPHADLQRHHGTRIGRLLEEVVQTPDPLVETIATDIVRLQRIVQENDSRIEVSLDVGHVTASGGEADAKRAPVCELELELKAGNMADLAVLARRWTEEHPLWLSTVSKAGRGERLLGKSPTAVKASSVAFPRRRAHLDGSEVQRLIVSSCLAQMLPNASEIAAGSLDATFVHQLRVGIRRLRTALRELEDLWPGAFDPAWETPLKRAFDALGKSRDRELLQTQMQPRLEELGGPAVDLPPPEPCKPLDQVVRASEFQCLLVELIGFASGGSCAQGESGARGADAESARAIPPDEVGLPQMKGPEEPASPSQTRQLLAKRLNSLHKKVARGGKDFPDLSVDEQHRVRKRLKRLRYLAEFVGPLFRRGRAQEYVEGLEPAQDALGDFNDKHVALVSYRVLTASDPRAWFAVGWLSSTVEVDADTCRVAIQRIAHSDRFWRRG